jgi:hypothetical protein
MGRLPGERLFSRWQVGFTLRRRSAKALTRFMACRRVIGQELIQCWDRIAKFRKRQKEDLPGLADGS